MVLIFPFQLLECHLLPPIDVKMTKLGFLRLSYEKQDTLLKLLILSMAAVLCECAWALFLWGMGRRKSSKKSNQEWLSYSFQHSVFLLLFSISIILWRQKNKGYKRTSDPLGKNEEHAVLGPFSHRAERDTEDPWVLSFQKDSLVTYLSISVFRYVSFLWVVSIVLIALPLSLLQSLG